MSKIVLFYVFTPLLDTQAVRLWQWVLCESLQLKGRIIISDQGINATVGGDLNAIKRYVRQTRNYAPFKHADIKWSDGMGADFPKLSVKVRAELVTFGGENTIEVNEQGVVQTGTHLKPNQLHELVAQRGDEVVFFDGRNSFEAEIGRFKNAIVPQTRTTKDFVGILDSGVYDHLKNVPVVTYCTGGIRCEVLSALMRQRGFTEVYQLDGGIVRYAEAYGDRGLWEGSLYVFDNRMKMNFTSKETALGSCVRCGTSTNRQRNFPNPDGRDLKVVCQECAPDA